MNINAFLDFFTALAPEGETALIVRQKPQLKNNEIQTHADGAVKATWPAYLPELKRIKDGQAWYGNTGSFIISRFTEGHISASKSNCEYVLVMMLDDVGTKAKIPPIEPTWIMETSEGSFQWGYAFAEQPTVGEYTAAIKAIADAGYTDPGATNAVRNFRIPGSVNLKPNREAFAARLIEFHPESEFNLPDLCAAMGVTPATADTSTMRAIRLADDGADDVAAWLSEQGLVLSRPNGEGWMGIICPNNAEHTDGNPEGRYNPTMRAYACMHSHCIDFDSGVFLKWVHDQGGPKHAPGFRDDLLSSNFARTLNKIEPSEMFDDDANKRIAEVNRKELGRTERAAWYERFAYIQNEESFFDLNDRREVSRAAFNALFRHINCLSMHAGANGKPRRVEASIAYDEGRQLNGAPALHGITFAAGESVLVSRDGDVYGNRWRNTRMVATGIQADVSPWLNHCRTLVPDDRDLNHCFDVMAYKLQHPNIKINHAILHAGDQGNGKDTMYAPFQKAIRGTSDKNVTLLDSETMSSQFDYALETEVLILNELREPDAANRRALANKLKPIIAAPPELLSINRKGLHPYMMLNRLLLIAFSNDSVPITLETQDRRWFCIWSKAPKMTNEAGAAIWAWYQSGGFEAVAEWLYARDVSKFNPGAAPPLTDFKINLIEQGMSTAESYLVDMMRARLGEFKLGVVASPFHTLCGRVAGGAPMGVKVPQAALLHALKEANWVDCGRLTSREYPNKKHIFCAPDMTEVSKSDLRRMVESDPPRDHLKLV